MRAVEQPETHPHCILGMAAQNEKGRGTHSTRSLGTDAAVLHPGDGREGKRAERAERSAEHGDAARAPPGPICRTHSCELPRTAAQQLPARSSGDGGSGSS